MNSTHSQTWHTALVSVCYRQRYWLQDRGSLTRRIQDCCTHFFVKPIFQSFSRIYGDELRVMGVRSDELVMVREVFLYCGATPVVFAHSTVTRQNLRGVWRGLNGLGNKSLGTMLFSNPRVQRTPLEFKKVKRGHFLYDRACVPLPIKPASLWARRSLFTLNGQSILVTEVFLPSILNLPT
ncbi:MAG: chorismate lyase [Nitrosomonas sp.]